jgi:hypothetical protein
MNPGGWRYVILSFGFCLMFRETAHASKTLTEGVKTTKEIGVPRKNITESYRQQEILSNHFC